MPKKPNLAALLSLGFVTLAASACPAADVKSVQVPIRLQIVPFRDAGGLQNNPAIVGLNTQLTQGLTVYLTAHEQGRFVTQSGQSRVDKSSPTFTLEGEVSHTQTDSPDGGPYLCILRLYEEGRSRRLAHQWAATAHTYLDLTSNLSHDARVNQEGLLGELANRIMTTLTDASPVDQTAGIAALVAKTSGLKRLQAEVIPERLDTPGPLRSGDGYRIRVTSQDPGSVYLVALDPLGKPSSLFVPTDGQEITLEADKPITAPTLAALHTGDVTGPTDRQVVVFVRRAASKPVLTDIDASFTRPAAVQVIDCGPTIAPTQTTLGDPGIAQILTMAAQDPAGTWLAQPITVHIEPKVIQPVAANPDLYVIAIGVDGKDTAPVYARTDAEEVGRTFQVSSKTLFHQINVQTLLDQDASRNAIDLAFKNVADHAVPADTFCFFYSGNGAVAADGQLYLFTGDAQPTKRGRTPDPAKGLSAQTLKTLCGGVKASRQLIAIDSGHAGYVLDAFTNVAPRAPIDPLVDPSVTVLAAAPENGLAYDQETAKHGSFTLAFLMGLSGAADDLRKPTGRVSAAQVGQYIMTVLPRLNSRQTPVIASVGTDFPLVSVSH